MSKDRSHIAVRWTPQIKAVRRKYEEVRTRFGVQQSVLESNNPNKEEWFVYFGWWHKIKFLFNIAIPELHGLSNDYHTQVKNLIIDNENNRAARERADYFLYVYNLCYAYISDNQTRIFGKANFKDLSHFKTLAMIQIANLCKKGMMQLADDKQSQTYVNRIKEYTLELMSDKELNMNSRSDDESTISCATTLDCIYHYKPKTKDKEVNDIISFYTSANNTNQALNHTLDSIDNYVLTMLFGKDINVISERSYKEQSNDRNKTNDELFRELFSKPEDMKEKDFKRLFDGLKYDIKIEAKSHLFFLKRFATLGEERSKKVKHNLESLFKARDKLRVLQNEIDKLIKCTNGNIDAFNSFLQVLEPYLQIMQTTKLELHCCLEQLKQDAREIYQTRKKPLDKQWQSCYWNKTKELEAFNGISTVSENLYKTLTMIPYNFYNAIKEAHLDLQNVFERSKMLISNPENKSNKATGNDENYSDNISKLASTKEIDRQSQLIIIKQKGLLQEYNILIEQLREIKNEKAKHYIEKLEKKKLILSNAIKDMETDQVDTVNSKEQTVNNKAPDTKNQSGDAPIKDAPPEAELPEPEKEQIGYFDRIKGWLYNYYDEHARKLSQDLQESEKVNKLSQVEIQNLKNELVEAKNNILSLQQENKELKSNMESLQRKTIELIQQTTSQENNQLKQQIQLLSEENKKLKQQVIREEDGKGEIREEGITEEVEVKIINKDITPDTLNNSALFNGQIIANNTLKHRELKNVVIFAKRTPFKEHSFDSDVAHQIKTLISNLNSIDQLAHNTLIAYKDNANQYDKTTLFRHNANGAKHAAKAILRLRENIRDNIDTEIKNFGKKVTKDNIDEFSQKLTMRILKIIENSVKEEIVANYSSYKTHSFRSYLRWFYSKTDEIIQQNKVNLSTKKDAIQVIKTDEISLSIAKEAEGKDSKLQQKNFEIKFK